MSLDLIIIRPGGNDTCLVFGKVDDPVRRKTVNDAIMRAYPNVEQVGFVYSEAGSACLQMAGGEFCGNATRSAAAALLGFRKGSMELRVSGVNGSLEAGITASGDAYARMPVYADPGRITKDGENAFIVEMEGITHYVLFTSEDTSALSDATIKERAYSVLKEKALLEYPAAGVMYVSRWERAWRIDPVVYVRDIDTLFRETACGSGTTALGMVLAVGNNESAEISVLQPSGMTMSVSVTVDGDAITQASIQGPIRILGKATLELTPRFAYVLERVGAERVYSLLQTGGLSALYRKLFSRAPYFESFTDEEVSDYFREYAANGILYTARIGQQVIGFGAALPLSTQSEIAAVLAANGIKAATSWYMADLGVDDDYRRSGVATRLVLKRLDDIPDGSIAVMRTSIRNQASQNLYRRLGFRTVEGAIQNVMQRRVDGSEVEDSRLFLAKQIL